MRDSLTSMFLKRALLVLSLTAVVACQYDLGERTLDMKDASTVVVERNMSATDAATDTAASCIALPSAWPEPALVEITGTAQVEGATQDFNVNPSRFTAGETAINALHEMEGYAWYCYIDTARDYAYLEDEDTYEVIYADRGKIKYTLNPSSDSGRVFTTLGFEEGGTGSRTINYYYNQMASHYVIKNHRVDSHFRKLTPTFSQADFDPANDHYTVIQHNGLSYFIGSRKAFSSDLNGNFDVREVPENSQIYLLNDLFVAYISDSDTGISEIRYSADMITWSDAKSAAIIGYYASTLAYDEKNSLYVALNSGSIGGETKGYYTSPDLENWTHNTVGSYQNNRVVFSRDGRAVMSNSSTVASLMFRTAEGDWADFTQYPSADNRYFVKDIILANDRFYVLLKEYDVDTSTYIKMQVGYSDDLTTWNWSTISTLEDDLMSLIDLTSLAMNQITVTGGERVYFSSDNGITWNNGALVSSALNLADAVDTDGHSYTVSSLINHNGKTYGSAKVSASNNFSANFTFVTTDFINFELALASNGAKLFSVNDSLYLQDSNNIDSWNFYQYVSPALADALVEAENLADELTEVQAELLAANEALATAQAEALSSAQALALAQAELQTANDAVTQSEADVQAATTALALAQSEATLSAEELAAAQANVTATQDALTLAQAQAVADALALTQAQAEAQAATDALAIAEQRALTAEENAAAESDSGSGSSGSSGIGAMGFFELLILMLVGFGIFTRKKIIA